ncbi:chromate efflux transporter [Caldalkalibacillus salinus]|uniref:chromate efflux transporter n=1 Tax=Caldalkalibacillus salinus TaxID=2803787 RepID=UPI00192399BA|nr:chromate efflux transporter [Caldalkalibacillus salinus]
MLKTWLEIFLVSLRLGLTSFGGPVAHLGYFYEEYIKKRKWLTEEQYANLVALCQFLPGPASSQVGFGIGVVRGGLLGGFVSFVGFTFPSILLLVLFVGFLQGTDLLDQGYIQGLKVVAVAIVAHALLGMGKKLASDASRATIAILAMAFTLLFVQVWSQVVAIILAGIVGFVLWRKQTEGEPSDVNIPISKTTGTICLLIFTTLLLLLPLVRDNADILGIFDSFYRAGALVFGGGHVVLPLLEREMVPLGWVSSEAFLAGYGAAQAVPGPLFTFASYLGAVMGGWPLALLATSAIFLPGFLLLIGTLPFWGKLQQIKGVRAALKGVNAAVVGILLAALYDPIWTSTILRPIDFVLAVILFAMLSFWKLPAWSVVIVGAVAGWLMV